MSKMIPRNQWKWFGIAGHYILGHRCQFHLTTQVGKYLISTVGERMEEGIQQKVNHAWLYETMVFFAGTPCTMEECHCGLPEHTGKCLDQKNYNERGLAQVGHMEMCIKFAKKKS